MSTYWYLECTDHDPPLMSQDEVTQHTDERLDEVRVMWQRQRYLIARDEVARNIIMASSDHMTKAAVTFIASHPNCAVQFRSEYGDTQPIEEIIQEDPV